MRKVLVYNKNGDPEVAKCLEYFREQKVDIFSTFSSLYSAVINSDDNLDIFIIAHGFKDHENDDDIIEFLKEVKDRTPINTVVKRLAKSGPGKIFNLVFLACYSEYKIRRNNNIEQVILYEKYIHSSSLLKLCKLSYEILPKYNTGYGYMRFLEMLTNDKGLLELNAFHRYRS